MPTPAWFDSLTQHPTLVAATAFVATYGIVVTMFALVAAAWQRRGQPILLVPLAVGAAIAASIDLVMGHAWFELRPFAAMHVTPLVAYNALDNSFPSDHAVACSYVAAFLYFVDRRWATVALIAALLVGVARVAALLHWPWDVAAGWAVGAACGVAAGLFAERLIRKAV